MNKSGEVRASYRPINALLVTAIVGGSMALLGVIAIIAKPPKNSAEWLAAATMLALVASPALWVGAHRPRAQIVADEEGLRWRGIGRWRRARWDEVTDFYTRSTSQSQSQLRVETRAGNFSYSFAFQGERELSLSIAQRAAPSQGIAARTRAWREDGEWPQVFGYSIVENWLLPPGMLLLLPGWLFLFWPVIGRPDSGALRSEIAAQLPLPLLLIGAACLAVAMLGLPLFFVLMLRVGRDAWRDERLVVTSRGVLFQQGARWTEATWQEMQAVKTEYSGRFVKLRQRVLETADGPIVWRATLGDINRFMALMEVGAPALFERQKDREAEENLAPLLTEKNGARIFHFRTRIHRALMWCPTALCLLPLLLPSIRSVAGEPQQTADPADVSIYGIAALALVATALGWLFYFCSSLRVSERGLEQVSPWGRKFIAWPDVREFFNDKNGSHCVRGETTTIYIRYFRPANFTRLREEIARRAVNSRTRKWEPI